MGQSERQFMGRYVLDEEGRAVAEPDRHKWADWMRDVDRRVEERTQIGEWLVSTVFLGIDHNWSGEGPPVLWETMIFRQPPGQPVALENGSWAERYSDRYTSLAAAREGHETACAWAREIASLGEQKASEEVAP